MGYSCTKLAGDTLDQWQNACYEMTKMSNRYIGRDGQEYFFEIGAETSDGSIYGSVYRMTGRRVGSFSIKPNGEINAKPYSMPKAFTPKRVSA